MPSTGLSSIRSRVEAAQKEAYSRYGTRAHKSPIRYAKPRNISQLRARGGVSRKMTLGEKQAYVEARGIKYTLYTDSPSGSKAVRLDRPSWYMGLKTVPSWVAKPVATYKISGDGSVEMYAFPGPVTAYRYYVHPNGEIVKVTDKGKIYYYPEGMYENAPYEELTKVPKWLRGIA